MTIPLECVGQLGDRNSLYTINTSKCSIIPVCLVVIAAKSIFFDRVLMSHHRNSEKTEPNLAAA